MNSSDLQELSKKRLIELVLQLQRPDKTSRKQACAGGEASERRPFKKGLGYYWKRWKSQVSRLNRASLAIYRVSATALLIWRIRIRRSSMSAIGLALRPLQARCAASRTIIIFRLPISGFRLSRIYLRSARRRGRRYPNIFVRPVE